MNEEEFLLLKSIALSLERIADSLEKNAHNEVDDKVDVAVESSDDTMKMKIWIMVAVSRKLMSIY